MNWFIFWCVLLSILFSYALYRQWRDDNARKDIERDLYDEFYDQNSIKRK